MLHKNTVLPYQNDTADKKSQVATMFNNIAKSYDFLNHFLSFGIDYYWRYLAIKQLRTLKPEYILDIATGTGDLAIEASKLNPSPKKITGVDISVEMLEIGKKKIHRKALHETIELKIGDAENLEFANNSFDAITVAFGVRNFKELETGLKEMNRVLKPGKKLVILEISSPAKFPMKQIYGIYSGFIMPFFGRIFSKDKAAYSYLPKSAAAFPRGNNFVKILENCGYKNIIFKFLSFGICTMYVAEKP